MCVVSCGAAVAASQFPHHALKAAMCRSLPSYFHIPHSHVERDIFVPQRSWRWLLEGEGSDDSDGKFSLLLLFALAASAASAPVWAVAFWLKHSSGLIDDSMLLPMPTVYSSGR